MLCFKSNQKLDVGIYFVTNSGHSLTIYKNVWILTLTFLSGQLHRMSYTWPRSLIVINKPLKHDQNTQLKSQNSNVISQIWLLGGTSPYTASFFTIVYLTTCWDHTCIIIYWSLIYLIAQHFPAYCSITCLRFNFPIIVWKHDNLKLRNQIWRLYVHHHHHHHHHHHQYTG